MVTEAVSGKIVVCHLPIISNFVPPYFATCPPGLRKIGRTVVYKVSHLRALHIINLPSSSSYFYHNTMAMLALKSSLNGGFHQSAAPQPRKRIPKQEGDISSVFASLAGDEAKALPSRFLELKKKIIGEHGEAILASWKRLIPAVEEKVREANEKGPSIFPEVQFADIGSGNIDAAMIERIKQTGACIIRNAITKDEAAEILDGVRRYIKGNPTTKGTNFQTFL